MDKKTVTLNIGREVEMIGMPTPTLIEGDSKRPMTVRDIVLQRIPGAASRDNDHATRLWNIGLEMDKAKKTFTLSEPDFKLLKESVLAGEMVTWVRFNINRAFVNAKHNK